MQVDLENKVVRFVVQEYVNAIVNFKSQVELDFDTHKLIHTFEVVSVAQKLIDLAYPKLSLKLTRQILNAAALHDIGRCHEFHNGIQKKHFNHGVEGAELVKKNFPNFVKEYLSTRFHNKEPSDADPLDVWPVLDYTRDADILGNLEYNVTHMSVFLKHILQQYPQTETVLIINREIVCAAQERRSCCYQKMEKFDFLDMMLAQLAWIYNLRTKSGFRLAKKEKLFPRCREVIISEVLPVIQGSEKKKQQVEKQIRDLFPDDMFLEEFKKNGI